MDRYKEDTCIQLPKKYENLVYYCKPTLDLVCDLWDSDFWCLNFLARKKTKTLQRYSYKPCEHFSHLNKSWFYYSILKSFFQFWKIYYIIQNHILTPLVLLTKKIKPNHCYQACLNVITDLIGWFLNCFRDEAPKPTVALEYTFGRRAKGHNIVSFCH